MTTYAVLTKADNEDRVFIVSAINKDDAEDKAWIVAYNAGYTEIKTVKIIDLAKNHDLAFKVEQNGYYNIKI